MSTLLIALRKEELPKGTLNKIRALAPEYDVLVTRERSEIEQHLADIEVAAGGFPRNLITKAHKLKWFQQWGAGADWLRHNPEARAKDFLLTNASGVHPVQIGEHIFALLLAFARQLPKALKTQGERKWLELGNQEMFELEGKTMLLIGVGAIGERTAKLAQAFGMRVIGMRRNPSRSVPGIDEMIGLEQLHKVLPQADIVVLAVPLTDETYHLIGERELKLMKGEAYIINIGRGGTLDEAALAEALAAGKFKGAGLDVFEEEPLPEGSPLWNQERVIITSHYAGSSPQYHERAFEIFLDNLKRFQAGKGLVNEVDKNLGY